MSFLRFLHETPIFLRWRVYRKKLDSSSICVYVSILMLLVVWERLGMDEMEWKTNNVTPDNRTTNTYF